VARYYFLILLLLLLLPACRQEEGSSPSDQPGTPDSATVNNNSDSNETTENAAGVQTPSPEPSPTASPTPLPPKELVVCLGGEPRDLYLYGDNSPAAVAVRHALYEPPIVSPGYAYEAVALEKVPSLADGDARLEPVTVEEGTLIVDAGGEIVPLVAGTQFVDAAGQVQEYAGEPVAIPQFTVDYTFKPLVWSDGTPLTAEDSVFSFRIAGDRNTPRLDDQVRYTVSYSAIDEQTVRWVGLPGYLDPSFMTHIWTPLPRHQLGDYSAAELATLEEAALSPLSYGPFAIEGWTPGEEIRLVANPHYYRAAEGLPRLDRLIVRFLSSGNDRLPAGYEACDVITQDVYSFDALPAIDEAAAAGTLVEYVATAGVLEQIIFGVDSIQEYAESHIDWFEDARVRQAFAQCIDRQALVDELTFGRAEVMDTFVPGGHRLHPEDIEGWEFDPAAANATLDELGYLDPDGDGIRNNIESTRPFTITLGTNSESDLRRRINEMVQANLGECGIQVDLYTMDAGTWFAPGPAGTVFGRKFDLAQFAWLSRIEPNCGLYLSENIPGPPEAGYAGWENVNVSGWSNEEYDTACRTALGLLPGQPGYEAAHQEAMRIFARELPAIPLFARMRLATTAPDVVNFRLDPAEPSELWNVFEWDIAPAGP